MYRILAIACVYALAGGYLDAYSYLDHGRVFANAQTGNVILFGVSASAGDWDQALRHVPPITAFVLGVAFARLLGLRSPQHSLRATLYCQGLELVTIAGMSFLDTRLPDPCVVPIISFVAALQNASFNKIGPWSFNSAMTTGNLRDATAGIVDWLAGQDTATSSAKAVALCLICSAFLAGALLGGAVCRSSSSHHLLPCIGLLAAGLLMTWRERGHAPKMM